MRLPTPHLCSLQSRGLATSIAITAIVVSPLLVSSLVACNKQNNDDPNDGLPERQSLQITSDYDGFDERPPPLFSFRSVVRSAKDAVVNLYTTTNTTRKNEISKPIPGVTLPPILEQRRSQSLGSGFIFDAKNGYLLTNWHVVKDADSIIARFGDSRDVFATLIGYDTKADLAVLQIPTNEPLSALKLATRDNLEAGDLVIAIGNPFGFANTVTVGVASATGRQPLNGPGEPSSDRPMYEGFIQTDASINPGNSGGPLLDVDGEVVGMNTAIYQQGTGLGFAIPTHVIKEHLPRLLEGGKIKHGWLGINIDSLPELAGRELGVKEGVLVTKVIANGPAEKADIKAGDIVVQFAGKAISNPQTLASLVVNQKPGMVVSIEVRRGDQKITTKLTLGERPD